MDSIRLIVFFVGLSLAGAVHGQRWALQVLVTDGADTAALRRAAPWPGSAFADSNGVRPALARWVEALQTAGYLEASLDTLLLRDSSFTALAHVGRAYQWVALRAGNIPEPWLDKAGFRARQYRRSPLLPARYVALQRAVAQQAANEGYPFAKVRLDSLVWHDGAHLSAALHIDRGTPIFFDALVLEGDAPISVAFLEHYLGIRPGDPYDEALVQRLLPRLRELPFLTSQKTPRVQFIGDRARILLDVAPKRASRLDFIIGVLPNSNQTGRLLLTTQLDGTLHNALGKGERVRLTFEQLRPQTQALELDFNYPYLLGLPFGAGVSLGLYRRDTNFININWQLGVDYQLDGGRSVRASVSQAQTNLLGIDSVQLLFRQRLPDTLDVSRRFLGLGFQLNRLDYRNNPRTGWEWALDAGAGQKNIRRNTQISAIGLDSLYDAITLRSAQYRFSTAAARYQPLGQNGTLKLAATAAAIVAPTPVLANEQYRLGGNRLLRGFDEQQVFATQYAVLTAEYRFLLGQNSYFYAFFDWAWADAASLNSPPGLPTTQTYQGLGAGITFETRAGLFGLSLALGRQAPLAFDPGAPKVHFGYMSIF